VNIINADDDLGRKLVDISVLGELKTNTGLQFFNNLIATPVPTTGTLVATDPGETPGIPLEQVNLIKLQARAVDGLALMATPDAHAAILGLVSNATSNVVRARAVHHYIFLHGDDGRAKVLPLLPADLKILADRFDVMGPTGSYNSRLANYLTQHPEVVP